MESLDASTILTLVGVLAWVWVWKGIALWKSARLSHRNWFLAFIIFNIYTFGILEIIYIFLIASKYKVETSETEEAATPTNKSGSGENSDEQ
ncbi:MAG TPA: DUF5652 family protein [Candidatus Paceibacterota bacterium]|nr:DUF5652 family protein [Candidatus Paceibacterota bacterium]